MKVRNNLKATVFGFLGAMLVQPLWMLAQDWYVASGNPQQRAALNSADMRNEFAAIQNDIADKLPTLAGNAGRIVRVNSTESALEAASTGVAVAEGGTGATTAADARTNLGLVIGTNVQAFDADVAGFAALTPDDLAEIDRITL